MFGNFLYFFGNFGGWKTNHTIEKDQFWVLSSEHHLFETHQIPSSTCVLTWEFQIWFQFSKLKKSDSIIFSTLWMQVGFPTTWLVFQPPKWWDRWNSNHMWHKMVWELKWWQTLSHGKMLAAMNLFLVQKNQLQLMKQAVLSVLEEHQSWNVNYIWGDCQTMAGEEKTSSTEAPPGAAWGPSEHSQQHQLWGTGVNIILPHCPKPNEKFVLVQEGDVSARRANIIAAGSLGKVMHSLYFFMSVCLFVKHWAVVLNWNIC